jgi:hypothetical protein
LFENRAFGDYWARAAGRPGYLGDLVKAGKIPFGALCGEKSIVPFMATIELEDKLRPIPLLFQAGYLSVTRAVRSLGGTKYFLGFPNLEASAGAASFLLSLGPIENLSVAKVHSLNMFKSLAKLDADGFCDSFGAFWACFAHGANNAWKVDEALFDSLFFAAELLAGEKAWDEFPAVDAGRVAHCQAPDGTRFVFRLNSPTFERGKEATFWRWSVKKGGRKAAGRRIAPLRG